jgi:hypothetical protein
MPEFSDTFYDMSQGNGAVEEDVKGPCNSGEQWQHVSNRDQQAAVDGGDGSANVKLPRRATSRSERTTPPAIGKTSRRWRRRTSLTRSKSSRCAPVPLPAT